MNEQTLELDPQDQAPPASGGELSPGATIAHFRVIRELGAGGMGRVYEAHDPDLDRLVAIKVVRDPAAGPATRDRMLREAQAMARLAHPNVIAIHEVGTVDGQLFLVMEHVRGQTLASWLTRPRTWRAILEVFVQAGEGLVAAHAAGIIHRDFKPTNVLVDEAGRVRVGDFGLAHTGGAPYPASGRREPASSPSSPVPALAAGSGPAVGTPGYIAPEQSAGHAVDARADQYAFAVSLQQALALCSARPPRRVRAAIARALSDDPAARFPELAAVVRELRAGLARQRRIVLASIVTGALAGGAAIALSLAPAQDDAEVCDAGRELVQAVWSPAHRDDVKAALRGAGAPADTIATATRLVDDWAEAWQLAREAACSADPASRPARVACLDRALGAVHAQLAVWRSADPAVATRAVATASRLPEVATCVASVPRGSHPVVSSQITALEALARSGRAVKAKDQIAGMLRAAEATSDPATIADALNVAAQVERELGNYPAARDLLARAAKSAGAARDQHAMTQALLKAAKVAVEQGRPLDAVGLVDAADAMVATGAYDRPELVAYVRGEVLVAAGRANDAIPHLDRAIALLDARATHERAVRLDLAAALVWMASAHANLFRYDTALPFARRALAIEEADLGASHPSVAETLHTIGNLEMRLGHYESSNRTYRRARGIFVAAYGERNETVGIVDLQLGMTAIQQGRYEEARGLYERAAIGLSGLPPDHPYRAALEGGLGTIERELDRCEQALPHFVRAIEIHERTGDTGTNLATQLTNRGACELYTRRFAEAKASLARAEALLDAAQLEPAQYSEVWLLQAELAGETGRVGEAIAKTRHMLAKTQDSDGPAVAALRNYARGMLAQWGQ